MIFSDTLIIMPAYNEAENLPRVIPELREYAVGYDVLVVDDHSSDDTSAIARDLGAYVVRLPCNLGYGGAVQTGFKYAVEQGYAYAVMVDADGQHDPRGIAGLLEPVKSGDADVAIGSRFLGQMDYRSSWVRRLGQSLFASIVARFTGRQVTDPTSGFQALDRRVLCFFAQDNYPSDYPDADTLLLLHFAGARVIEVPVRMRERMAGVAMHGGWKTIYYIFKMFLAIFIVLLRQTTSRNAICAPDSVVTG